MPRGLAQRLRVGRRVQHVVAHLEGDADPLGVAADGLDGVGVGVGRDGTEFGRRAKQGPGLAPREFHVLGLVRGLGDEFGRLALAEFDHRLADGLHRPLVGREEREGLTQQPVRGDDGRAVAERRPRRGGPAAQFGLVDDVVDDQRRVVDQLDADGEVEGVVRVAAQRLADQHRHGRSHPLAPRERDVPDLVGECRRFDVVEHRLQSLLDAVTTPVEILHHPGVRTRPKST